MENSLKIKSLTKIGYNFDALKYFIENAYSVKVNDIYVALKGMGLRPNRDLVVSADTQTGTYLYSISKELDESAWLFENMNSANPTSHFISNSVMNVIYPTKDSKYDIVKSIDSAIASGTIKNDSLYIDNICDVLECEEEYGTEFDGAKMMERDVDLLQAFSSEYSKENASDSEYRYDMMKNTKISDEEKLELNLAKRGILTGVSAELYNIEKFMKDLPKNIAKESGVNPVEGVTYTFTSNGCTFTGNNN